MIKAVIRFQTKEKESKGCARLDTCPKIRMILDRDLLESQYQDIIREVCGKCSEFEKRATQDMMVMVFDKQGEQIPEYQGQYEEVKESILRDAPLEAVFAHGLTDNGELRRVSKEEW